MKSKPAFLGRTHALLALACVAAWGWSAQAQPVYRVVGPDGKVTFSDKPPADAKPAATVGGTSRPTDNKPALPYELQQLAGKYPVTLYSTNGCGPCDSGRALLTKRGIPFVEKTVNTNEDMAAFARLYAIMGAQRATKILGIFARLDKRDGKPQYLAHLPRIWAYLQRCLAHPALAKVKRWVDDRVPPP